MRRFLFANEVSRVLSATAACVTTLALMGDYISSAIVFVAGVSLQVWGECSLGRGQ